MGGFSKVLYEKVDQLLIRVMKKICYIIGRMFSYMIPRNVAHYINSIGRYIYTGYFIRFFKSFGSGSSIEPTAKLGGLKNISIGRDCHFQKGLRLSALTTYMGKEFNSEIIIGDGASFGPNNHITCAQKIQIGNYFLTGGGVLITDNSHGRGLFSEMSIAPAARDVYSKGPIIIGNNVWLGDNVSILPGVVIGDNVVIGSNAVVVKDIPSYSVAVGNPAHVVKRIDAIAE